MDGLLNFSRDILPANRGGQMDAPLVLTTRLNPTEVDKEALNVDSGWFYERDFYETTQNQPHPKDIANRIDFVERRLGTVAVYEVMVILMIAIRFQQDHNYLLTRL